MGQRVLMLHRILSSYHQIERMWMLREDEVTRRNRVEHVTVVAVVGEGLELKQRESIERPSGY